MAGSLTFPPAPPEVLTCDDIIRAGACMGGVQRRLARITDRMPVAAAETPERLLSIVLADEARYISAASGNTNTNGYGDGYGYGYGYGSSSMGEGSYT